MQIKKESTHLGEIVIVTPEVFKDERGFFMENIVGINSRSLACPRSSCKTTIPARARVWFAVFTFSGDPYGQADAGFDWSRLSGGSGYP